MLNPPSQLESEYSFTYLAGGSSSATVYRLYAQNRSQNHALRSCIAIMHRSAASLAIRNVSVIVSASSKHTPPSTYVLEKAVRVAARKLGRTASVTDVEQEALRMLAEDGFAPTPQQSSPSPPGHVVGNTQLATTDAVALHLSISAAPCASRRLNTQRATLYDLLRKELLSIPDAIRSGVHLHVRDTSALLVGHPPDAAVIIAETLAAVAEDIPIAGISGPFIDAALTENLPLLERLPDLIGLAANVCPTVQVGTLDNGHPEAALSAVSFALALASSARTGMNPVIVSVNDCDRRAFGHRVHQTAVVAHSRAASIRTATGATPAGLNDEWQSVSSADLPLVPGITPDRTTDLILTVQETGPDDIRGLLEERLLTGGASGARRQLLLLC